MFALLLILRRQGRRQHVVLMLQTRTSGSRKANAARVVIRIQLLVELLPSILPSPYLRSFPHEENPSSLTLPDRFHNPHVVAFISIFIVIIAAVLLFSGSTCRSSRAPHRRSRRRRRPIELSRKQRQISRQRVRFRTHPLKRFRLSRVSVFLCSSTGPL